MNAKFKLVSGVQARDGLNPGDSFCARQVVCANRVIGILVRSSGGQIPALLVNNRVHPVIQPLDQQHSFVDAHGHVECCDIQELEFVGLYGSVMVCNVLTSRLGYLVAETNLDFIEFSRASRWRIRSRIGLHGVTALSVTEEGYIGGIALGKKHEHCSPKVSMFRCDRRGFALIESAAGSRFYYGGLDRDGHLMVGGSKSIHIYRLDLGVSEIKAHSEQFDIARPQFRSSMGYPIFGTLETSDGTVGLCQWWKDAPRQFFRWDHPVFRLSIGVQLTTMLELEQVGDLVQGSSDSMIADLVFGRALFSVEEPRRFRFAFWRKPAQTLFEVGFVFVSGSGGKEGFYDLEQVLDLEDLPDLVATEVVDARVVDDHSYLLVGLERSSSGEHHNGNSVVFRLFARRR